MTKEPYKKVYVSVPSTMKKGYTMVIKRMLQFGMDWMGPRFVLRCAMPERVGKRVDVSVCHIDGDGPLDGVTTSSR